VMIGRGHAGLGLDGLVPLEHRERRALHQRREDVAGARHGNGWQREELEIRPSVVSRSLSLRLTLRLAATVRFASSFRSPRATSTSRGPRLSARTFSARARATRAARSGSSRATRLSLSASTSTRGPVSLGALRTARASGPVRRPRRRHRHGPSRRGGTCQCIAAQVERNLR
jgi:hypothetical protein